MGEEEGVMRMCCMARERGGGRSGGGAGMKNALLFGLCGGKEEGAAKDKEETKSPW